MRRGALLLAAFGVAGLFAAMQVAAQTDQTPGQTVDQNAKKGKDGKWVTADGTPTFHIGADGTVDWYTFSGYRRYNAACIVCHGPDGEGSSYAPSLVQSLKTMSYQDFLTVVASGRQDVNAAQQSVMPALGDNVNVMCFIDDIYVYLKARAAGALPRGRPQKHDDKPEAADNYEKVCLGVK